ncbi:MAG TPA: DNA primase [Gemmatimonadales bacterium]|nr:DNA primase [Gemmatimonadales bacterium]
MSRIPDEVIEQVRDAADIVALIGESVELKRTGTDYRGPCPFHGGTHRNFAVIPRKGMYHCFVCHAAGDVFTYLMKRYGMDYPTAVRQVAGKVGIVIPEGPERSGPDPDEPIYNALAVAHDWFQRQLRESPDAEGARKYLLGRDIPLETAGELGLGWAPAGNAFFEEMKKLGLAVSAVRDAGLMVERDDGSVGPRFRKRLIIPIHNIRGRVVAFGGRLLGDGEPKYLNSPESKVFHKGQQLYNLHAAKNAIRKEEAAVVVEGYFDTIRMVLGGIEHVVAPLGTSLTEGQAQLLTRYTKQVVVCYDSDGPGLKAAFRAADECLRAGLRVRVATLPDGQDPDDVVKTQGGEAMRRILADAMDVMERKIDLLEKRGWFTGVEKRREGLDRLLPTIRATKDPVQRAIYLDIVAQRTKIDAAVLQEELKRGESRYSGPGTAAPADRPPAGPSDPSLALGTGRQASHPARHSAVDEWEFLRLLVADPEWTGRAKQDGVTPDWFEKPAHRELYEALLAGRAAALPDGLSSEGELLWSELKEAATRVNQERIGDSYEALREVLEARPQFREFEKLMKAIERAPAGAKDDLIKERESRRQQLSKKYPSAWKRWYTRRRAK